MAKLRGHTPPDVDNPSFGGGVFLTAHQDGAELVARSQKKVGSVMRIAKRLIQAVLMAAATLTVANEIHAQVAACQYFCEGMCQAWCEEYYASGCRASLSGGAYPDCSCGWVCMS